MNRTSDQPRPDTVSLDTQKRSITGSILRVLLELDIVRFPNSAHR